MADQKIGAIIILGILLAVLGLSCVILISENKKLEEEILVLKEEKINRIMQKPDSQVNKNDMDARLKKLEYDQAYDRNEENKKNNKSIRSGPVR